MESLLFIYLFIPYTEYTILHNDDLQETTCKKIYKDKFRLNKHTEDIMLEINVTKKKLKETS
jgi:hypothetical protein